MKIQILCVLFLVGLASSSTNLYPRGCIYALGKCIRECEEGTMSYTTGCGPLTREATCEVPTPSPEPGNICDYTACYCAAPTVRRKDGKCVKNEEC